MPDRSIVPAIRKIEQVAVPQATSVTLDNGIPLHYLNAGNQPVMRLEIIFNSGKWFEMEPGTSFFTGKMIAEGTEQYSAREIAAFFDELGAFVEVGCGFDRITLTVHLLARHLTSILPMIRNIINTPNFPESELNKVKERKKQKLLVDLQKNSFLAAQHLTEKIFGDMHPYGLVLKPKNITNTSLVDIQSFYGEHMKGNFEITLSGMVKPEDVKGLNAVLGQDSVKHQVANKTRKFNYFPTKNLFEKEGSLQCSIRMGVPFINRNHPEFLEMLVVNEILGGYFGSRLMRNIREDKGYSYGIGSSINCMKHASIWVLRTDVMKKYRDQTLEEITKEIEILHNHPVPETELETVKNYMLGTFVSSLDTPFALADKFKIIHYSDLDYSYYQKYFKTVRSIDSKRIQELSRKYLQPDNMTTVAVG